MKILVNDIAASHSGAMTVLKSFYEFVKENDSVNEYIFLLSDYYLEPTDNIRIVVRKDVKKSGFHKLWFDFVSGKYFIKKFNADYVLSLQNIITFGYKGLQAVYVHQSIPFQKNKTFSLLKKSEYKLAVYQHLIGRIIKLSIKKADNVFVQTVWMKERILSDCKISNGKIAVIPLGINLSGLQTNRKRFNNHFFYPTVNEELYKNHSVLYKAVEILNDNGFIDYSVELTLEDNPNRNHNNIKYCGPLSRQDLFKKYETDVLIFPSYIETVGLPLLEMMAHGGIVLAADCEYARELLSNYDNAYFFNPFSADELATLMKQCIEGGLVCDANCSTDLILEENWSILIDILDKSKK